MNANNSTINQIFSKLALRYGVFVAVLFLFTFGVGASYSLYSSHKGLCELVTAKADAIISPISRELILGNAEQAMEIFRVFKAGIASAVMSETLQLSTAGNHASSGIICRPSMLGSSVSIPLKLGSETFGQINGKVSYFSWIIGFGSLLFFILSTIISIRLLARAILRRISRAVMAPIEMLSNGVKLTPSQQTQCVSEVLQINSNIDKLAQEIKKAESVRARDEAKERFINLSVQVAHDIRSPLTALNVALGSNDAQIESRHELMKRAIARIEEIANELLNARIVDSGQESINDGLPIVEMNESVLFEAVELASLIDAVVHEKRCEYSHRTRVQFVVSFDENARGASALVNPGHFKRMMSNVFNNSIEAIADSGVITCIISESVGKINIVVKDDGRGMPDELIPKLAMRGASFGKLSGCGLRLSHAIDQVQAWGGTLNIYSKVGLGTQVSIDIPLHI